MSATVAQPRIVIHYYPRHHDRGVLKWDCPVFAAYSDGSVIWRKHWAASLEAFTITDGQFVAERVQAFEAALERFVGRTFKLTDSSDQEFTTVWIAGKTLTIIGNWRKPDLLGAVGLETPDSYRKANEHEQELWATLPARIRETLARIDEFDDVEGRSWHPDKVNVLLQPPSETRIIPVVWPSQLSQSFALLPGSREMESIELPWNMLGELLRLLPNDGEPKAVTLNGKTRYVEIRFVFPGQSTWLGRKKGSSEEGVKP